MSDSEEKRSICVVEDSPEMILFVQTVLHDFNVLSYTNPRESYSALEQTDLLLLDYDLPEINGLQYLDFLKENYPDIPVIMITGHGSEEVCQKAFRAGVNDYIRKPFVAAELREIVLSVLSRQAGDRDRTETAEDPDLVNKMYMAKHYIDQHIDRNIKLDEVLKCVGMSKTPFEKHFKARFNTTFSNYVLDKRIRKAKEMLEKGSSVSAVADHCGFRDISHFSKTFKKYTGILPSKFKPDN